MDQAVLMPGFRTGIALGKSLLHCACGQGFGAYRRPMIRDDHEPSAAFRPHEEIVIRSNRFRYVDGLTASGGYAIQVNGARGLIVSHNHIETVAGAEAVRFLRCDNVSSFDNRTSSAVLLPQLDSVSGKYREELDIPAEDALLSACFPR